MRLDVPFIKQSTRFNCGPTALKMILDYFGKDYDISLIEKETGILSEKGIFTVQIAIAASRLGFKSKLISKHPTMNPELLQLDYYQKFSDLSQFNDGDKLIREALEAGVEVKKAELALDELLSNLSNDSIPIVTVDWNVITTKPHRSYTGHFVPVVGYDERNVYVHNQGFNETMAFMPIERSLFDKARKAVGTDEDIVVVYRKK